jgi:hypothetical protein
MKDSSEDETKTFRTEISLFVTVSKVTLVDELELLNDWVSLDSVTLDPVTALVPLLLGLATRVTDVDDVSLTTGLLISCLRLPLRSLVIVLLELFVILTFLSGS